MWRSEGALTGVPEGCVARHLSADVIKDIADSEPGESSGPCTPTRPPSSSPARTRSHRSAASQQLVGAMAASLSSPPPSAQGLSPRRASSRMSAGAADTSPLRAQSWAEVGAAQPWSSDLMAELQGTVSKLRIVDASAAGNGGEQPGAVKVRGHRKTKSVL